MKLEHKRQKVISFPRFLLRLSRYGLFAIATISVSLTFGMTGYHYVGGLSWLDSFHMSSMILTGMGPVADMKSDGIKQPVIQVNAYYGTVRPVCGTDDILSEVKKDQ